MMATMDFDLAAIPREFPQFGKSVWNLGRTRQEVFGGKGSKCSTAGAGSGKCADAGCGCSGCGCEGGSCGCSYGGGCGSTGGRHAQDAEGDPFGLGEPQVPVDPVYAARRDWGPRTRGGQIRRTEGGFRQSECDIHCLGLFRAFEQISAMMEDAFSRGDSNMYYQWRYQLRIIMRGYQQCPVPPCPPLAMPGEKYFEPPQRTVNCPAHCHQMHWDCMFCHYVEGGDFAKATPDCNSACAAASRCKMTWADCPDPGPRWRRPAPPSLPGPGEAPWFCYWKNCRKSECRSCCTDMFQDCAQVGSELCALGCLWTAPTVVGYLGCVALCSAKATSVCATILKSCLFVCDLCDD
jgi:hypothetical protein